MESKENNKRFSKTIRSTKKKHLSFNQIIYYDKEYNIPKEIIWLIEEDLDKGIFELCKYYNLPVKLQFADTNFSKLPPNVLLNRHYFNSALNRVNLNVKNEKSERIFYYYPNGKKVEYFDNEFNTIHFSDIIYTNNKGPDGSFICDICNTKCLTKEALINHKTTKKHLEYLDNIATYEHGFLLQHEEYYKPKIDSFIDLTVRVNKDHFLSKSEYKKKYHPGCKTCIRDSSTALTKGYGKKSSKKTKGRNKRGKDFF